jgi:hypothetical protein
MRAISLSDLARISSRTALFSGPDNDLDGIRAFYPKRGALSNDSITHFFRGQSGTATASRGQSHQGIGILQGALQNSYAMMRLTS